MRPVYGTIYLIRNEVNSKVYVGQTINSITKRWSEHKSAANRSGQGCPLLQRAMAKYGVDSFTIEPIATCADQVTLNKLEHYFIQTVFQSTNKLIGYNLNGGGNALGSRSPEMVARVAAKLRGQKRSDECRAKMSATRQNMPLEIRVKISATLKGRPLSEETRKRMSESRMGRVHSVETRAKMSASSLGKKMSPEAVAKMISQRTGKKQKPEHVAKRSASNTGRKRTEEQRARMRAAIIASFELRKVIASEKAE